jgi:hypothetical protein
MSGVPAMIDVVSPIFLARRAPSRWGVEGRGRAGRGARERSGGDRAAAAGQAALLGTTKVREDARVGASS